MLAIVSQAGQKRNGWDVGPCAFDVCEKIWNEWLYYSYNYTNYY